METILKIRRLCLVDKLSISEVARRFQLSRNTVSKYLSDDSPPSYHQAKPRHRPRLGPFCDQLTLWLEQDLKRPKREQRTATALFQGLQDEGYEGAYDSVSRFVKVFREKAPSLSKAFVPLSFAPGEAYQFDWSLEVVELGGVTQKIKVAHFRMSYSRKCFVVAYHRESMEMLLDAHVRALEFFGGVPSKVIIDNPKTMVSTIGTGKERKFNLRFLSMMNHYLIEPVACTPAAGWEKGQVENQVSNIRQWLFTPKANFSDLAELNEWLHMRCEQLDARNHPIFKDKTIGEVFVEDLSQCRPAMAPFDGYVEKLLKVSPSCLINYDRNRYSVPAQYVGKLVSLHAYADRLSIIAEDKVVAQHPRSFERDQSIFDAWHYVPVLMRKPGALRNGTPFKDWDLPPAILKIKAHYLKQTGGDRDFVELLLMIQRYDLESVNIACELALEEGTGQLSTILNILHRLLEPQTPKTLNAVNYPHVKALPKADCQRYDGLIEGATY